MAPLCLFQKAMGRLMILGPLLRRDMLVYIYRICLQLFNSFTWTILPFCLQCTRLLVNVWYFSTSVNTRPGRLILQTKQPAFCMPGQSSSTRSPEDRQQRPPAMIAMSLLKGLGIKTGTVEVDVHWNVYHLPFFIGHLLWLGVWGNNHEPL